MLDCTCKPATVLSYIDSWGDLLKKTADNKNQSRAFIAEQELLVDLCAVGVWEGEGTRQEKEDVSYLGF